MVSQQIPQAQQFPQTPQVPRLHNKRLTVTMKRRSLLGLGTLSLAVMAHEPGVVAFHYAAGRERAGV